MKPDKTITIMADFGFGPYAWLKDTSDESDYVGINIANSHHTGMDQFDISDHLQKDFADWIGQFERGALDNPSFPWASFHKEGLALSRRLKEEIGEAAIVVYVKPYEDPGHEQNEKTWFISEEKQQTDTRVQTRKKAAVRQKKNDEL
ncbi:MAG: hypothetical protein HY879_12540 [Deltaproteobacteria bacterium]|nr:hypothetical protein [Deltaproteobacteria bacterium]